MLDTSIIVSVKRIITTTVVETIAIVGKVEVVTGTKSVVVKLDIVMVTVSVVGLLDTVTIWDIVAVLMGIMLLKSPNEQLDPFVCAIYCVLILCAHIGESMVQVTSRKVH